MLFPSTLPKALQQYLTAPSEGVLLGSFIKKISDLVLFFESASDDETWTEGHISFMRQLLAKCTEEDFLLTLSEDHAKRLARAVRRHYGVFKTHIPCNFTLQFKDGSIEVNTLLLGEGSSYFKLVFKNCLEKEKREFSFSNMSLEVFNPFNEYSLSGEIAELWRMKREELLALLQQAAAWKMTGVELLCEQALKKYIEEENVHEVLRNALANERLVLKQACIDFVDERRWGFSLFSPSAERLGLNFENFSDETLAYFKVIRDLVTDLSCHGDLIENPVFARVVRECPRLLLVDVSNSTTFSKNLLELPSRLQGLNLSQCQWVMRDNLRTLSTLCPEIKELLLCSNIQMGFGEWGELIKFKSLRKLDLARCHQLKDEDLSIVLKACANLTELSLDDCPRISPGGFFAIARDAPKLMVLNLARTNVTDAPLIDIAMRCKGLLELSVARCEQLSEKGVVAVARYAQALKTLDVTRCQLSHEFLEDIKRQYPQLQVLS